MALVVLVGPLDLMKIPIVNRGPPVLRREIFGPSIPASRGISLPDVLGRTRNYCEFLSAPFRFHRAYTRSPILDTPIVWIDSRRTAERKKAGERFSLLLAPGNRWNRSSRRISFIRQSQRVDTRWWGVEREAFNRSFFLFLRCFLCLRLT